MSTVSQALHEFISALELTDKQDLEAREQRDRVKAHLLSGLSVKEVFISGSFGRRTAIRPLKDIDLFIVLNRSKHEDLYRSPRACLRKVREVLDKPYPDKELPTLQRRSVNIQFSGTDIGFDVVPAFEDRYSPEVYEIPDRNPPDDRWIHSNPRKHKEHSTAANERTHGRAIPLVKALKHWNNAQKPKKALRSFHLELMVYAALQTKPESDAVGLMQLFEDLATRVMSPCPDPAGLAPDVAKDFPADRRQRAQALLREAAAIARKAVDAADSGRVEEAHFYWRSLFGERYPEVGKQPAQPSAAPAVATSPRNAPDDPGKRFG